MSRIAEKRAAKISQIHDVAAPLFAGRGFAATRMEDIDAATGMQKPSLYYYFESKEELLTSLVESRIGVALERLTENRPGKSGQPERRSDRPATRSARQGCAWCSTGQNRSQARLGAPVPGVDTAAPSTPIPRRHRGRVRPHGGGRRPGGALEVFSHEEMNACGVPHPPTGCPCLGAGCVRPLPGAGG